MKTYIYNTQTSQKITGHFYNENGNKVEINEFDFAVLPNSGDTIYINGIMYVVINIAWTMFYDGEFEPCINVKPRW